VLQERVGPVERVVVPVEAATCFGDVRDEGQQDGAEEGVVGVGVGVGAGKDRGGGLPSESLERDRSIASAEEPAPARLDEVSDERTVLVQRRSVAGVVLLERERDLGALLDVAAEEREGAEAEAAQG
jgi:hypothetical protein